MSDSGGAQHSEPVDGRWIVRNGRPGDWTAERGPYKHAARIPTGIGDLYGVAQDGPESTPESEAGPDAGGTPEEALDFNNPFGQEIERVWFDGRVVYAMELGEVDVDLELVRVAQEYQVVYSVELDEAGKPIGEPERVPGQLNIYDSVPGMEQYSPLWQFNYVIVPHDFAPNTLRSEADCLESGYPILRSTLIEN